MKPQMCVHAYTDVHDGARVSVRTLVKWVTRTERGERESSLAPSPGRPSSSDSKSSRRPTRESISDSLPHTTYRRQRARHSKCARVSK